MAGASILIIEDEAIVREDLRMTLEDAGYHVVGAVGDGEEGLMVAREHAPNLALVDVYLSGSLDGVSVAEMLDGLGTRIVFTSGATHEIDRARSVSPLFLSKPFSSEALLDTVREALNGRNSA